MDADLVSGIAFFLALFASVFVLINNDKTARLKHEIRQLQRRLDELSNRLTAVTTQADAALAPTVLDDTPPPQVEAPTLEPAAREADATSEDQQAWQDKTEPVIDQDSLWTRLEGLIKKNGLLWLGAGTLAMGGLFLAKHAIEAGFFPPALRLALGGAFGISLVLAAEFLARNQRRFNINSPYISAALASGGVVSCFAMLMVAYAHYHFISPAWAFVFLAITSLSATSLALRFGPLLAGIGLIGSYVVPLLVTSDNPSVTSLLVYVFFVSSSAMWVAGRVKQAWLWWQSCTGHFLWFLVVVSQASSTNYWPMLIFCLASMYLYAGVHVLGWSASVQQSQGLSLKQLVKPAKEQLGLLLPIVAMLAFLGLNDLHTNTLWTIALFSGVLWLAAYRHSQFDSAPFLALALMLYGVVQPPLLATEPEHMALFSGGYLFVQLSALASLAYHFFMSRRYPQRPSYLLLLVLCPLSLYGLSYALSSPSNHELYSLWAAELLLIAMSFSFLSRKAPSSLSKMSYLVLVNACLSLCMTMLLDASTLTLALALQVTSISYLSAKFSLRLPNWLYKVMLIIVGLRLSAAPWLDSYAHETIFGLHWTMVIYPVVLLATAGAYYFHPDKNIKLWFKGAMLHLTALLLTTETSYVLLGKYPQFLQLEFREAVLLAMNWLVLSVVYFWRSIAAGGQQKLYQIAAFVLLAASALLQLKLTIVDNPFYSHQFVVSGRLINWLLPLWGIPALLYIVLYRLRLLKKPMFKIFIFSAAGLNLALYINTLIRSLFNQGHVHYSYPISEAELYCYSVVWLAIATVLIFKAQQYSWLRIKQLGFALLFAVVCKAFLIDMAHLAGLYRAISFIGLGLSLVGLGWLFQRLANNNESTDFDSKDPA